MTSSRTAYPIASDGSNLLSAQTERGDEFNNLIPSKEAMELLVIFLVNIDFSEWIEPDVSTPDCELLESVFVLLESAFESNAN